MYNGNGGCNQVGCPLESAKEWGVDRSHQVERIDSFTNTINRLQAIHYFATPASSCNRLYQSPPSYSIFPWVQPTRIISFSPLFFLVPHFFFQLVHARDSTLPIKSIYLFYSFIKKQIYCLFTYPLYHLPELFSIWSRGVWGILRKNELFKASCIKLKLIFQNS